MNHAVDIIVWLSQPWLYPPHRRGQEARNISWPLISWCSGGKFGSANSNRVCKLDAWREMEDVLLLLLMLADCVRAVSGLYYFEIPRPRLSRVQ